MIFVPAVQPAPVASASAWHFVFVDGQLLLPADADATLLPLAAKAFETAAATRHYLGRLDTLDCWALTADAVPPASSVCPCAPR